MSTIRDYYGLYGLWDVGTIGTTWITNGTVCMPPGLQMTLDVLFNSFQDVLLGFLPVPLVLPVSMSDTVTHGRLKDYRDYWNWTGIFLGITIGTANGIIHGTIESRGARAGIIRTSNNKSL